MSTEMIFEDGPDETPPIVVDVAEVIAKPTNGKKVTVKEEKVPAIHKGLSPALQAVKNAEDSSLKDIVDALGANGSFRIRVNRTEPDEARDASGKMVPTAGYLKTYEKEIDEDFLQSRYGGGTYQLEFKRRNAEGRYVLFTTRNVVIAGEPDLSHLPKSAVGPSPGAPLAGPGESPTVVSKAMEFMNKAVEDANARADRREDPRHESNPAVDAMIDLVKLQLREAQAMNAELRREMAETRNKPEAPVDTFKDKLLDKFIDGDSARILTVRTSLESEMRALKENAREDEKRMRDSFERDKADMRASFEREMAMMRQSHENTLMVVRSSNEVSLAAAKSSFETQTKLAEAENRRLERDNADLRIEVKELRAKKDKTLLEQVKDVETIKEALGVGEETEKSNMDRIIEAGPTIFEGISQMINKRKEAVAPAAAAVEIQRQAPQIFAGPNGQRFMMRKGKIVPVKPRPELLKPQPPQTQTVVAADGTSTEVPVEAAPVEAPIPEVDPELVTQLINYLENAFGGNQDAQVVAQSMRSRVPEGVLIYLRDRISEHGPARGVDEFLAKVAKLPGTSPLAAQSGRNWIRKVGVELVGE